MRSWSCSAVLMVEVIAVLNVLKTLGDVVSNELATCDNGLGVLAYERVPGYHLSDYDIDKVSKKLVPVDLLLECRRSCLHDVTLQNNLLRPCGSINFLPGELQETGDYTASSCQLTEEKGSPDGVGRLVESARHVHFNEICMPAEPISRVCPNRVYVFDRRPNTSFVPANGTCTLLQVNDRRHCERRCLLYDEYVCRSATYSAEDGTCHVCDATWHSSPHELTQTRDHEYLENTCITPTQRCQSPNQLVFVEERAHMMTSSHKMAARRDVTLHQCKQLCVNSDRIFCRSIEFRVSSASAVSVSSLSTAHNITGDCFLMEDDSLSVAVSVQSTVSPTINTHHRQHASSHRQTRLFLELICLQHRDAGVTARSSSRHDEIDQYMFRREGLRRDVQRHYVTAFRRYSNKRMDRVEPRRKLAHSSAQMCLLACLKSTQCLSVTHSHKLGTCELFASRVADMEDGVSQSEAGPRLVYHDDYDHYDNLVAGETGAAVQDQLPTDDHDIEYGARIQHGRQLAANRGSFRGGDRSDSAHRGARRHDGRTSGANSVAHAHHADNNSSSIAAHHGPLSPSSGQSGSYKTAQNSSVDYMPTTTSSYLEDSADSLADSERVVTSPAVNVVGEIDGGADARQARVEQRQQSNRHSFVRQDAVSQQLGLSHTSPSQSVPARPRPDQDGFVSLLGLRHAASTGQPQHSLHQQQHATTRHEQAREGTTGFGRRPQVRVISQGGDPSGGWGHPLSDGVSSLAAATRVNSGEPVNDRRQLHSRLISQKSSTAGVDLLSTGQYDRRRSDSSTASDSSGRRQKARSNSRARIITAPPLTTTITATAVVGTNASLTAVTRAPSTDTAHPDMMRSPKLNQRDTGGTRQSSHTMATHNTAMFRDDANDVLAQFSGGGGGVRAPIHTPASHRDVDAGGLAFDSNSRARGRFTSAVDEGAFGQFSDGKMVGDGGAFGQQQSGRFSAGFRGQFGGGRHAQFNSLAGGRGSSLADHHLANGRFPSETNSQFSNSVTSSGFGSNVGSVPASFPHGHRSVAAASGAGSAEFRGAGFNSRSPATAGTTAQVSSNNQFLGFDRFRNFGQSVRNLAGSFGTSDRDNGGVFGSAGDSRLLTSGAAGVQHDQACFSDRFVLQETGRRLRPALVRESVSVSSLSQCERACVDSSRFFCRSLSYRYSSSESTASLDNCELSDVRVSPMLHAPSSQPATSQPDSSYEQNRDYDFYERDLHEHCSSGRLTPSLANSVTTSVSGNEPHRFGANHLLQGQFAMGAGRQQFSTSSSSSSSSSGAAVIGGNSITDDIRHLSGTAQVSSEGGEVRATCDEDGMRFMLTSSAPFYGRIYTFRHYDTCRVVGRGDTTTTLTITAHQHSPSCGTLTNGDSMNNIVVVQFSEYVQTRFDKRYNLTCYVHGPGEAVVTSGYISASPGQLTPVIDLPAREVLDSRVRLSIVYEGRPTTAIAVGDPLLFRLETQAGANLVSDVFAYNVIARDPYSGRSVQLIDDAGCPTDPRLFPALSVAQDTNGLEARFNAFKIPQSNYLLFEATVRPCRQQCRPAACAVDGRQEVSFGRRRRRSLLAEQPDSSGELDEEDDPEQHIRRLISVYYTRDEMKTASAADSAATAAAISSTASVDRVCVSAAQYDALLTAVCLELVLLVAGVLAVGGFKLLRRRRQLADKSATAGHSTTFNSANSQWTLSDARPPILSSCHRARAESLSRPARAGARDPSEPMCADESLFDTMSRVH